MFNAVFCKQSIIHILEHKRILLREKQKMLSGALYYAGLDYILYMQRQRCKKLCHKFNLISPEKLRDRNLILSKILGKVGKTFMIEQPFMCDYGFNIEIGNNFCANHNLIILDPAKVVFGDNVLIGPNCSFYTAEHPINPVLRKEGLESAKEIIVGNNVWFGGNVVVLPNVRIGDNAVIGAGSVVNKDIPANTIAVGNPCKVVKTLF